MTELKVTQIKSRIGGTRVQRETLRSLGLRRIGDVVVKQDRPETRVHPIIIGITCVVAPKSPSTAVSIPTTST